MERYFVNIETMEITDSISESLMQTVIYNARILLNEPGNYNACLLYTSDAADE